ncbi:MAG: DUF2277 domain-containing protein [Pyrinomonadaceae bacterium]|nr:DUF2277 domain-containing protein [Pyrinomonadaceae bacterium]
MCRNIRTLYNYEPPATQEEVEAAALQYVRKISGFQKPSKVNTAAFENAVENISRETAKLVAVLKTSAPAKNREVELAKARERNRLRFGNKN